MHPVMKTALLVLAAGSGSRFGGAKQAEPLGPAGETILEYSIHDAMRAGFDEAVFLVRAAAAEDFRERVLRRLPASLRARIAIQEPESLCGAEDRAAMRASGRAKPWGTGQALLCAASELDSPFAIVNADDFYGRESFRLVHDFLAARGPGDREWCMAGYRLRNTASARGAVSRGICRITRGPAGEPGLLASVTEEPAIEAAGPGFVALRPEGEPAALTGDETVSMNFWGLTPAVFGRALPLFRAFLDGNRGSAKAEFYLPALVDALVSRGEASVRVLPTEAGWFGLTYRGDAGEARERLAALVSAGEYPSPLWDRAAPGRPEGASGPGDTGIAR